MPTKNKNYNSGLLEQIAEYNLDFAYLGFRIDVAYHKYSGNRMAIDSLELRKGDEVFGYIEKYGNSYKFLQNEVQRWTRLTVNYAENGYWRDRYDG